MACFITPNKSEENRHYWKLKRVPLNSEKLGDYVFCSLHDCQWWFHGNFYDDEDRLMIGLQRRYCFIDYSHIPKVQFYVRVGICKESREVIAVSESQDFFNSTRAKQIQIPIKRSEIQSIMQTNKVLYFFIEEIKNGDEKTQDTKTRKRKIETDFEEILLSGKNSDLTIEVKSKKFKCHRLILATRSPVFSAMMEHDMKEKASGIVTIQDVEPSSFQEFLLYLYTGNQCHLNWKNVLELYKLGDKYAVEDLKNVCVEHMKEHISIENLFHFFLLSQQCNETKLSENVADFFRINIKKIIGSEKWIEFLKNNPDECNLLLKAALINE